MPSALESSTTQISETRVDEKTKLTFTAVRVQADEEREVDDGRACGEQPQPEARLEAPGALAPLRQLSALRLVDRPLRAPLRCVLGPAARPPRARVYSRPRPTQAAALAVWYASGTSRGWRGGCNVAVAARKVGQGRSGDRAQRPCRRK